MSARCPRPHPGGRAFFLMGPDAVRNRENRRKHSGFHASRFPECVISLPSDARILYSRVGLIPFD